MVGREIKFGFVSFMKNESTQARSFRRAALRGSSMSDHGHTESPEALSMTINERMCFYSRCGIFVRSNNILSEGMPSPGLGKMNDE